MLAQYHLGESYDALTELVGDVARLVSGLVVQEVEQRPSEGSFEIQPIEIVDAIRLGELEQLVEDRLETAPLTRRLTRRFCGTASSTGRAVAEWLGWLGRVFGPHHESAYRPRATIVSAMPLPSLRGPVSSRRRDAAGVRNRYPSDAQAAPRMFQLLKGLAVLDLTTVVLGPYATQILADLGAQVTKVEPPSGDVFRAARPGRTPDVGVAFQNFNRNKRSLVLDLKRERGRDVLHRLVARTDVVVHNMRPSSADALGLSYEALVEIKPDLVYCHSAGFGEDGPDAEAPAYDDVIQARSGLASLNATQDGEPRYVRTIVGDKTVGLHLAVAVLAGVLQRERTGRGTRVSVPMLECMASYLLSEHLAGRALVPPVGNVGYDRVLSANRRPYETRDGWIAVLPYSTKHWIRLFEASSRPELASDPRVVDPVRRSEAIDELYGLLAEEVTLRTTDEWLQLLAELDVPCARVSSLDDLLEDEHLLAVEMFEEIDDESLGRLLQVRSPFRVDGKRFGDDEPNRAAQRLGAQSHEVLEELGLSVEEIAELRAAGVTAGPAD